MNEPKLRFPEFKDIWNSHKIEDMFDRVGTPVDLDDTLTYREIGIRSHGKGIFHKDETTASEIGDKRIFWVEPDCFVVNIVFAWERAVAKTTEAENGMIASHRFPMYKPKKDVVDLDYITEYFITKRGQNILILASPGGAGRNKTLGQKEFAKSVVKLPSLPEQQKIAEFLSTIDTVIEKQKETVSAWEERKKGVMQKLFGQEVRFKADDGSDFPEWEEKKLGEILAVHHGKDYKNLKKGNVPVYGTGGIITYVEDFLCDWACVCIGRKGTIDKPLYIDTPFWCVDTLFFTKAKDKHIPKFQFYLFQMIPWKKYNEASGVPSLNASTIQNINVTIPCPEEQQKIADCLSSLDEAIDKQKATLAAWEELKKGLLQQMFV